ncbi:MAG: hypothetical protein ACJ762_04040 [Solirubrobacteraceae bacterium]
MRDSDVVLEFTSPAATAEHAELAAGLGTAMVIGTTGLSPEQGERVRQAARRVPVQGTEVQRPSAARWAAQAPAALGMSFAQLQIDASTRPSVGSNWSKPKRLTPQAIIALTFAGERWSAAWSAGVWAGSMAAETHVLSS